MNEGEDKMNENEDKIGFEVKKSSALFQFNYDESVLPNKRDRMKSEKELSKIMSKVKEFPRCLRTDGNTITIGKTEIISTSSFYIMEYDDYTLVANVDLTPYYNKFPKELKPLLQSRWHYVLHVSHGMTPSITRANLQARVRDDRVLAYKYTECSIEGNEAVYYGFIPVDPPETRYGTHRKNHFALQAIWPRKLYVYINYAYTCPCSSGCSIWQVTTSDGSSLKYYCIKRIPWHLVYVMLGSIDDTCTENVRSTRLCIVCAQCVRCAKSPTFCKTHKKCNHKKQTLDFGSEYNLKGSKIKKCLKYRA